MKDFFMSLYEVQKVNNEWVRKHWKGYTILSLGSLAVWYGACTAIDKYQEHCLKKEINASVDKEES